MLRFAYLDSSHDPTVLLWGDQDDMRALVSLLQGVPSLRTESLLAELGCHAQIGETVFVKFCETGAQGMRKVEGTEGTFRWELDRDHLILFAERVEVLASSQQGHKYLEIGTSDEITVKASCCEYPDNFLIE
jgi:hypothetical protein